MTNINSLHFPEVGRKLLHGILLAGILALAACATQPPEGIHVVDGFELARYEGRWYEIARLDHRFERGLTDVSARYQRQPDGSVEVINRGYDPVRGKWREAVGRALFTGDPERASLKVSFFGPFYGGYNIIALDRSAYRWAMVLGPDRDYLWILARDRQVPEPVRDELLAQARAVGIDTDRLIWVSHTRDDAP
ncbi:lipocalin [Azoarcus sp. DD4]|uniref:lipocalin family protein n=1 Tax=Azoarcus sp. DD4 TaxID=2027405 RepID=UPI00112D3027|nr:lipocalin family protein [Azoarcus sp. DD4]QDF97693.1 lipocalin [Azoarcus sp. DD4]